jgi:tetrahydromethanopterin S-methyltransferase subunit B
MSEELRITRRTTMDDRVMSLERRTTAVEERLRLEDRMAAEICEERVKEVADRLVNTNERLRVFEETVDELEGFTDDKLRNQAKDIEEVDDRVDEIKTHLLDVQEFQKSLQGMCQSKVDAIEDKMDEMDERVKLLEFPDKTKKEISEEEMDEIKEYCADAVSADQEVVFHEWERRLNVCEGYHEQNSKRIDKVVDWRHEELETFLEVNKRIDAVEAKHKQDYNAIKTTNCLECFERIEQVERRMNALEGHIEPRMSALERWQLKDGALQLDATATRMTLAFHKIFETITDVWETRMFRIEQRLEAFEVKKALGEDKESPKSPPMKRVTRSSTLSSRKPSAVIDLTCLPDSPEPIDKEDDPTGFADAQACITLENMRADEIRAETDLYYGSPLPSQTGQEFEDVSQEITFEASDNYSPSQTGKESEDEEDTKEA